jgi:4-alpha-glucanotransferase
VSEASEALRTLAARVGIIDEYFDITGRERRVTSDETRRLLLAAMGFDAATDEAVRASLAALGTESAAELIPPVRVVEVDDLGARHLSVPTPSSRGSSGPWRLEIQTEQHERVISEGPWRGEGRLELALPPLPIGYHTLRLTLSAGGGEWSGEQTLIVVPSRCVAPSELLGDQSAFGVIANLYTIRSKTNWGIGDLGDLAALTEWAGLVGADFVGVNPLHALLNRGHDVSPYSPVSRLFRNPIYIDVTRVPELADAPAVRARLSSPEVIAELEALRDTPDVRYEQVMAVKGLALDVLHRVFVESVRGSGNERDHAYAAYVARHEPALTRFATWMTIAERQHSADWRSWPAELHDADSEAVRRIAQERAHRVDFHRWLQFETDRQLATAAAIAGGTGMRIGLYQDLAIGSSPTGADTWTFPQLFVDRVSVGAPPDPYAEMGQNWGLPPIDPRALRRNRYEYFIKLVRAGFRHAGALRIDHVMGLFRLFWIPEGRGGKDGAYVRYPASDLLGIVALESVRHNALVVGEDLGTVPEEVPPVLRKWGILSSKVLQFEREWDGGYKSARSYPPLCLATANTHDMVPLAGFWAERDITVRRDVGLANEEEEHRMRADRERERGALIQALRDEQILNDSQAPTSSAELRAAVHGFLWSSPAQLVGLSLDDLAGEVDPVNVPGVGPDKYPSWTRKMRAPLEGITSNDDLDVLAMLPTPTRSASSLGTER